MTVIGLTGQTGAGKSTVCNYFRNCGWAVIDCDKVSREVTERGERCLTELAEAFSSTILGEDGSLDRRALGRIVFSDRAKLEQLNNIIFPHIIRRIEEKLDSLREKGETAVILDAPTLFESGADRQCDAVMAVIATPEVRLGRIMERDGLTREDAAHRMASQHSEDFFRQHADFLIENNSSLEALAARLRRAGEWIKERADGYIG